MDLENPYPLKSIIELRMLHKTVSLIHSNLGMTKLFKSQVRSILPIYQCTLTKAKDQKKLT